MLNNLLHHNKDSVHFVFWIKKNWGCHYFQNTIFMPGKMIHIPNAFMAVWTAMPIVKAEIM